MSYYIMQNIGKCKYLVSYHNGVNMYKDNSPFYDVRLFSNKVKMKEFIKELESKGYKNEK